MPARCGDSRRSRAHRWPESERQVSAWEPQPGRGAGCEASEPCWSPAHAGAGKGALRHLGLHVHQRPWKHGWRTGRPARCGSGQFGSTKFQAQGPVSFCDWSDCRTAVCVFAPLLQSLCFLGRCGSNASQDPQSPSFELLCISSSFKLVHVSYGTSAFSACFSVTPVQDFSSTFRNSTPCPWWGAYDPCLWQGSFPTALCLLMPHLCRWSHGV